MKTIINNTTANTNNTTMNNMTIEQMKTFAYANRLNKGRGFSVVKKTNKSGYYHVIESLSYKCLPNEVIVWSGTPMQYAIDMPTFATSVGKATYEVTAYDMVAWELDSRNQ